MRKSLSRACRVDGCANSVGKDGAKDMCNMHYLRFRKHGSPDVVKHGGTSMPLGSNPNWTGDDASYFAVHLRVRRQRGSASAHLCVDCEGPAAEWSYDNADPNERTDPKAGRYSTNLNHYKPRCVGCHRSFDRAARVALLTGERPEEG